MDYSANNTKNLYQDLFNYSTKWGNTNSCTKRSSDFWKLGGGNRELCQSEANAQIILNQILFSTNMALNLKSAHEIYLKGLNEIGLDYRW